MLRKLRVFRLECPGNKCSESARLILQIAQPLKMANPVMDCFADADLRRVIQDAGFIPRQRTTLYERYVN